MKKLINSFTAVLFIITTFIIAGCSENSPVQTGANLESAQHLKQVYKDGTAQSLMQDLRNNLNINSAVSYKDSAWGTNGDGRTTLYYNGQIIWTNTWNSKFGAPAVRTRMVHGYSLDHSIYFIQLWNESFNGTSSYDDDKLFISKNNGPLTDISSDFKYYKSPLKAYSGKIFIPNTDSYYLNSSSPVYLTLWDAAVGSSISYEMVYNEWIK